MTARQRDGARLAAAGLVGARLARAISGALASHVPELVSFLEYDPHSEAAWTAVADLALTASILERDRPEVGRPLVEAMRSELGALRALGGKLSPGPEQWAAHVAGACLDSQGERERLQNPHVRSVVGTSRQEVLKLGPVWRPEEVAYVGFKLGARGSPPPIREVALDAPGGTLYELTHVAFFTTDFGAVRPGGAPEGAIALRLAAKAAAAAELFAEADWQSDNWVYDLGVELVLAALCLANEWPEASLPWTSEIMPERARASLAKLKREPGAFQGLYHLMAMTALGLARA